MKTPTLDIDKNRPLTSHARMYRRVIASLLTHIQKAGFTIEGIHDGEEFTRTATIKESMEIIFNLDEAHIIVTSKANRRHRIFIVLGNDDPEDIVCDWSFTDGDPDGFNAALENFKPS